MTRGVFFICCIFWYISFCLQANNIQVKSKIPKGYSRKKGSPCCFSMPTNSMSLSITSLVSSPQHPKEKRHRHNLEPQRKIPIDFLINLLLKHIIHFINIRYIIHQKMSLMPKIDTYVGMNRIRTIFYFSSIPNNFFNNVFLIKTIFYKK